MTNKGPVSMEDMGSDVPSSIAGRKVDPDKNETTKPNTEVKNLDKHMKEVVECVPEELKERVSKLQREELSMPGIPRDREAYDAYINAEKIIRDKARRKARNDHSFKNLPTQTG
jgi:hypothetical protein